MLSASATVNRYSIGNVAASWGGITRSREPVPEVLPVTSEPRTSDRDLQHPDTRLFQAQPQQADVNALPPRRRPEEQALVYGRGNHLAVVTDPSPRLGQLLDVSA